MNTQNPERRVSRSGWRLFRAFGVELVADWSLIIIFGLVVMGLGAGLFPDWHPDWSAGLMWGLAAAGGVGLIASIALHELAHALVANRCGVNVRRITLFLFGGVTHMKGRPAKPTDELRIAAAGPFTSIVLGILMVVAGGLLVAPTTGTMTTAAFAASLGPATTLLLWLGTINILLALFNMLPGFPLDGGRVLRAVLWHFTHSLQRATLWASRVGKTIAWALMALGVLMAFGLYVPLLGVGPINGIWMLLIGWFLNNAARMSYSQLLIDQALAGVDVGELVQARKEPVVEPTMTVAQIVDGIGMTTDTSMIPVVSDGHLRGVVVLERLETVPPAERGLVTADEVMIPLANLSTLHPEDGAMDALQSLAAHDPMPVVDGDHLVGLLRTRDVSRWLAFHTDAVSQQHRNQI